MAQPPHVGAHYAPEVRQRAWPPQHRGHALVTESFQRRAEVGRPDEAVPHAIQLPPPCSDLPRQSRAKSHHAARGGLARAHHHGMIWYEVCFLPRDDAAPRTQQSERSHRHPDGRAPIAHSDTRGMRTQSDHPYVDHPHYRHGPCSTTQQGFDLMCCVWCAHSEQPLLQVSLHRIVRRQQRAEDCVGAHLSRT